MGMISFDIGLQPDQTLKHLVKCAKLAEENNVDRIWIGEYAPLPNYRDSFVGLTAVAQATSRIKLGPGILIPYIHHPALIAVFATTLCEASNDRVSLGLGVGGELVLRRLGIKSWIKPITALTESVEIIRRLFNGETLDYDGKIFQTQSTCLLPLPKTKIPIYIGARGPMMLRLAGRIADGVLMRAFLEDVEQALATITNGAKDAGKSAGMVDIADMLTFSVSRREVEKARDLAKLMASWIVATSPEVSQNIGIKKDEVEAVKRAVQKNPSGAIGHITDKMVDAFSIAGNPDYCIKRISERVDAGLTHFVLTGPLGPDPLEAITILGKEIIPSFK
jgi:5,10-methylenetetrahydromethanopterin reductase